MVAESRIGQVLVETYRIERLIAEGGMGSVFEARHIRLPKRFAVKFLNLTLIGNHEAQARFRREAEIIAALDHPSIVSLLDYNVTEDGVPFIVLEFLDGEHLGRRITRGPIGLGEALRIIRPVAGALSAAHQRDIIHRDLKPENIVLCAQGVVKVVDFGIAKIRDGQELTQSNTILGTLPYMAPEQLFGSRVSPRTDQFALGAILYEMLTGEMAFGGPTSVPEVAARVAHHQPPDVPGVPQAVNAALLQAMAKDPEARFPSVQDFVQALGEAATRPDEPAVAVDLGLDGLPPLLGEATVISSMLPGPPPETKRPPLALSTGEARLPEPHAPAGDPLDADDDEARSGRLSIPTPPLSMLAQPVERFLTPAVAVAPMPSKITPAVAVVPPPLSLAPRPLAEPPAPTTRAEAAAPTPRQPTPPRGRLALAVDDATPMPTGDALTPQPGTVGDIDKLTPLEALSTVQVDRSAIAGRPGTESTAPGTKVHGPTEETPTHAPGRAALPTSRRMAVVELPPFADVAGPVEMTATGARPTRPQATAPVAEGPSEALLWTLTMLLLTALFGAIFLLLRMRHVV